MQEVPQGGMTVLGNVPSGEFRLIMIRNGDIVFVHVGETNGGDDLFEPMRVVDGRLTEVVFEG